MGKRTKILPMKPNPKKRSQTPASAALNAERKLER